MATSDAMKPIIVIPNGTMTAADKQLLIDNGLCVVEATNPALVKFVDPIPSVVQRGKIETAALALSRKLLNRQVGGTISVDHSDIAKTYVSLLLSGTSLDNRPTQQEKDQEYFDDEKRLELARLARQEAKEEREAIKAAKVAAAQAKKAAGVPAK